MVATSRPWVIVGLVSVLASAPVAAQQVPELVPIEPAVGCLACDGPAALGAIQGLALAPDGAVVVTDRDPPHVRIFEPDGSLRGTFGRSGRGPGEFGMPGGVAVLEDGRLLLTDFRWTHVGVFDADGAVEGTIPVASTTSRLTGSPNGQWAAWQVADWTTMSAGVSAIDREGVDAGLASTPLPTTADRVLDAEERPAALGLFASAIGPDGRVAVGSPWHYRFVVLGPGGSELHTIARDVARTERTADEIEALREQLLRGPAGRADNPEAGAGPPQVDPLRPHFLSDGVAYDGHGRLWVRTARGGPGVTIFDVFAASGAHLGEIRVDHDLRRLAIANGVLAAVAADPATGVERVLRWRIEG